MLYRYMGTPSDQPSAENAASQRPAESSVPSAVESTDGNANTENLDEFMLRVRAMFPLTKKSSATGFGDFK